MPWAEEVDLTDLLRFLIEHFDEQPADSLALVLGVGDAGKTGEEAGAGVHRDERNVVVAAEQIDHLACLVLAQQTVIDEDAGELIADRFVDQERRDGRVDAAREPADHAAVLDLRSDARDLGGAELRPWTNRPGSLAILCTKLAMSAAPSGVCTTSGWNCTP